MNVMWEQRTRFWEDVGKCLKKRLGKKKIKELEKSETLEKDDLLLLVRLRNKCYYEQIRKIPDDQFESLLDEIMNNMQLGAEQISTSLRKYDGRFINDPRELMQHLELKQEINEVVLEEFSESIDIEDSQLMDRLLSLFYINDIWTQILLNSMRPFFDAIHVGNQHLGIDSNWVTSVIALEMEEALIKKKIRELGEEPVERSFHNLVEQLKRLMKQAQIEMAHEILLSKGFREVRNELSHDLTSWHPSEDETHEHIRHIIGLAKSLFPEQSNEENPE